MTQTYPRRGGVNQKAAETRHNAGIIAGRRYLYLCLLFVKRDGFQAGIMPQNGRKSACGSVEKKEAAASLL